MNDETPRTRSKFDDLYQEINLLAMNTNERINDERSETNQKIAELKRSIQVAYSLSGFGTGIAIGTVIVLFIR